MQQSHDIHQQILPLVQSLHTIVSTTLLINQTGADSQFNNNKSVKQEDLLLTKQHSQDENKLMKDSGPNDIDNKWLQSLGNIYNLNDNNYFEKTFNKPSGIQNSLKLQDKDKFTYFKNGQIIKIELFDKLCLDVESASNKQGKKLCLWNSHEGCNQKFRIHEELNDS